MTEVKAIGERGATLALMVTGVLIVLLSFQTWGSCPTTPCGGILMAISEYSGLDLGFGVVTALAGIGLAAIGFDGRHRKGDSRFATIAALLGLLVVAAAGASVLWMYVLPGDGNAHLVLPRLGTAKEFHWPPFTAALVGIVGLIALAASLRLRRATHGAPR